MIDPRVIKLLKHPDSAKRKKAVSALAKSKDPEALKLLARVYRTDEDADVRELARKGGVYIKKQTGSEKPKRRSPDIDQYTQDQESDSDLLREVSAANQQRAAAMLQQALDMNMNGNDAKAFDMLVRAFATNPRLELDSYATNLATTISGLPRDEALAEIRARASRSRARSSGGSMGLSFTGILPLFMIAAGFIYLALFLVLNWIDVEISFADMLEGGGLTDLLMDEGISEEQLAEIGGAEGLEMMLGLFGMEDMKMQIESTALGFIQAEYDLTITIGDETQSETIPPTEGVARATYEYSPILLGFVAIIEIALGALMLFNSKPMWYWLQALGMTVIALIPFLWTYVNLNNDIPAELAQIGITSGRDMLGQGFWIGLGATVLMGVAGLFGMLSTPQSE